MDSSLFILLATVVLPGALVWAALGLAWVIRDKPQLADTVRLLGLGIAAALPPLWVVQALNLPPKEAADWIPWILLGAVVLGLLGLQCPWRRGLAFLLFFGLVVFSQTSSALHYQWSPGQGTIWVVALTVALSLQTESWRRLPLTGAWVWFVSGAYLGLVAGTLLVSGSASLGQRAGIAAAGVGSVFLWSFLPWARSHVPDLRQVSPLLGTISGALLIQGHLYADVLFGPLVLLLLAPLAAWLLSLVQKRPWITAGVLLGLSVLALVWSISVSPPTGY
jgi:hypothetical protein